MPGSTAASSAEQTKAKVTDSSASNGIFVRPVAVAGIFRPADESANKPPALPEKRRFSALSGDLRPCSGPSNEDFARRRQSWDAKPKEAPFGQALLRKTPRSSGAVSGTQPQESTSNGSSREDIVCNDKKSLPEEKVLGNLNSTSVANNNSLASNQSSSDTNAALPKGGSKLGKTLTVLQTDKGGKDNTLQLSSKNQNSDSNQITSKKDVNIATNSTVVNSFREASVSDTTAAIGLSTIETTNNVNNAVDGLKQPKKVYGLRKRDSKCESTLKSENSSSESKAETNSSISEKSVLNKDSQLDVSSKSENLTEKIIINTPDSSKNKSKVYGVNKTNFKREAKENEVSNAKPSENKPAETLVCNKISDSVTNNKKSENKVISKAIVNNVEISQSETKNVNKQLITSKTVNKVSEVSVSNEATNSKPINKVDTNAASKTLENKLINKPPSADIINKPSEVKIVSKTSTSNVLSKNFEQKEVSEPLKTNSINKTFESANKSSENESKENNKKIVNKASQLGTQSTVSDTKIISQKSESNSIASKEIISPETVDSKTAAGITKIDNKVNEFTKAQSPPKDFRTVRRTSDVIAARIQNIFSNFSSSEKPPPPLVPKKPKTSDRSSTSSDKSSVKVPENKNDSNVKVDDHPVGKQTEIKLTVSNEKESKSPDSKSGEDNILKVESKKSSVIDQKLKNDAEHSEKDSKKECKYKEQTSYAAEHSVFKKENKLASESSDVLQSNKAGEVLNALKVKTETPPEKADSKTEHSVNPAPSKAPDKKILNIGGKMPIKKQDSKCLDGTASPKAANQDDRKSSDSTATRNTVMENTTKELILKTEFSNTCADSGEKVSKSIDTSNKLNTSVKSTLALKNVYNSNKIVDSSLKEICSVKSAAGSISTVKTNNIQHISTKTSTLVSEKSHVTEIKKISDKTVSSCTEITENSNNEVVKVTPSTVPGIVPTVNVLFRTKSPQTSATKEENRKIVVVETFASSSPVPSAIISPSKVSEKITVKTSRASESVQEALKAVESVQKSLNSPKVSTKYSSENIKKDESASVIPTASSIREINMPPNSAKNDAKCSSVDDAKTEMPVIEQKTSVSTPVRPEMDKDQSSRTITPDQVDSPKVVNSSPPMASEISDKREFKSKYNETFSASAMDILSFNNTDFETNKSYVSETKLNVVDLDDWTKKFQRLESEPPRAPSRRRVARESMPPVLPVRSRFGSLKRIDDSPRYIARSPSQSSLPQRYSYTEMLSKVCSMGVLPYSEPFMSKSCSSSSSQVSELWSELSEEQSTATHTAEMLESETTERMRLEKEVQELQNRCSQVQLRSDKMEMEMMEARVYRTPELNGDISEDEDAEGNSSLYKQKYERAVRDMEIMKRRIQQQHEEEMEQKAMLKKASDKRLAEALEDVEEERQVANQWKRKAQKLGSELQDLRLMLEEQMARNGELEKKQRRFDAELSAAQEEIKKERLLREKFCREKEQAFHEKYSLEQELQASRLDADTLHEKITQLNRELDELTLSSKGEEEVTQLKRAKQELERKCRDQEEELEELAAQVSMLEQAKLRLEMSLEKVRQEHRREASVREEEIEEIRACFSKKIKNLEAQLESEQDERHQLMKQKHELERRLYEIADQPPPQDPEIERRLRRDLKRTKALLRDAQSMLEHTREGQSGKTLIRQLKNQLEDSEFAKATAVKARQAVEAELHDCQTQLEEATRVKNEVESRCLQLSREKSAIQTQLEEAEEEMAEVMKKYKAVVAQMSIDQKTLCEQNQQIADLETEKQMLKDQLSEVSHKFEHLAGQSEDTHKVHRLDGKVRDLESKLELELTTRSRLEHQIARLKEQSERMREECDSLRNKELQAQEGVRRLQRQMRDLREDYSALQQKEAEAYRKQHELEMALENTETDLQVTKNDLRLACQRIQDLQSALEDDLDSGTDVPDDSGSDSDDSFELNVLRNRSITPTQRCDSAASNYSLASEGFRSRTSSFTHELSAFSSRNDDAESKDLNGLSGMNTSSRLLDVEHDEAV